MNWFRALSESLTRWSPKLGAALLKAAEKLKITGNNLRVVKKFLINDTIAYLKTTKTNEIVRGALEAAFPYHYFVYYGLVLCVFFLVPQWHIFIFIFVVFEFLVFVVRAFDKMLWYIRIIPATLMFGALDAADRSIDAAAVLISTLHRTLGLGVGSLIAFNNSIVDYFIIIKYYVLQIAALLGGVYCATLAIFLPLISSIVAFCAGHLIGALNVARVATALIFIAFLAACYIFILPYVLALFKEYSAYFTVEYTKLGNPIASFGEPGDLTLEKLFLWVHRRTVLNGEYHRMPSRSPQLDHYIGLPTEADSGYLEAVNDHCLNIVLEYANFITTPFLRAKIEFVIDSVSAIMVLTITGISFIVHAYSTVYMRNDPHSARFFGLLSLFTFFMLVLVAGSNLIMLYIGWEGVGLSSFLLIAFWYTRVPALKSALKAILINKIGDMFLVLGIAVLTLYAKGTTIISILPALFAGSATESVAFFGLTPLDIAALAFVVAAFVKSAQIFFHTWLPDAMEGPTPVSALLHAATMVTAGVYLLVRFSWLLEMSPIAKNVVFFGGLYTVVFSSVVALTQFDIKKIIAYSTCSQLGLMFLACGLSAYDLALFHFFNHAFFKCLLFLLAGVVIHELGNEQDIRKMGGLWKKMPITFACFSIASLSLAGFPGFSGAISKDLVLLLVNHSAMVEEELPWKFFLFSINIVVFLSVAYVARLNYYVFFAPRRYRRSLLGRSYVDALWREPAYAAIATLLSLVSVLGGRTFLPYFAYSAPGSRQMINVHHDVLIYEPLNLESLSSGYLLFIPPVLTLYSFFVAWVVWKNIKTLREAIRRVERTHPRLYQIYVFFNRKGYFDDNYNILIARRVIHLSYLFNRAAEDGLFKFFAYALWRFSQWPLRWEISTMRYGVIHHIAFSSAGIIFLLFAASYLDTL